MKFYNLAHGYHFKHFHACKSSVKLNYCIKLSLVLRITLNEMLHLNEMYLSDVSHCNALKH